MEAGTGRKRRHLACVAPAVQRAHEHQQPHPQHGHHWLVGHRQDRHDGHGDPVPDVHCHPSEESPALLRLKPQLEHRLQLPVRHQGSRQRHGLRHGAELHGRQPLLCGSLQVRPRSRIQRLPRADGEHPRGWQPQPHLAHRRIKRPARLGAQPRGHRAGRRQLPFGERPRSQGV